MNRPGGGMRRAVVAVAVLAGLCASPLADADLPPVPEIPKIHIEPPAPGLPAPLNPPYQAPLDLDPPPRALAPHPRLLFSAGDLPTIRARIADPASMPGRAWSSLVAGVDERAANPAYGQDGRFGRQDLADVGFVWLVTRDPKYFAEARRLLTRIVAATPGYGAVPITDVAQVCCEYYNTRAHILAGLGLAWDFLVDDLPAEDRLLLATAITTLGTEHAAWATTTWWSTLSTASNFTGNNGASVGLAGLAVHGDILGPLPAVWIAKGRQLVDSYVQSGFDDTGASLEGVLYGNYGLRIPTMFGAALERAGAQNPLHHPHLRVQPRWTTYELLPGGGAVNPLNDARYHDLNPVHLTWASRYGQDPHLAGWMWGQIVLRNETKPSVGEPIPTILWYEPPDPAFRPEQVLPLGQAFPGRGLVHTRTGWGAGELMSSFEARQNVWGEGIHHNQDVNSFTLYAEGARFVIDNGYANWLERNVGLEFEGARSSTTEAHNYVVVDGRGQDFFSTGRLTRAASTAGVGDPGAFDVAVGDARLGYLVLQPQRADRYWVHVRGDGDDDPGYLLVGDVFRQDAATRRYTSYLHTEPGNRIELAPAAGGATRARFHAPNGAALDIATVASSPAQRSVGSFTADYPEIGTHPRLEVSTDAPALESLMVLAPTSGAPTPAVVAAPASGGLALTAGDELVLLRTGASGSVVRAGAARTDGGLAVVTVDATGRAHRFVLVEGSVLDNAGRRLAQVWGGPATVATSDTRVVVEGDGVVAFRVESPPAVHTVTLDGREVRVARCGTAVVYPARSC